MIDGVIIYDEGLPTVQHVVAPVQSPVYTPQEPEASQVYPAVRGEKGEKGEPGELGTENFNLDLALLYQVSKL